MTRRKYKTIEEAFNARAVPNPDTGCIEWTGATNGRYGIITKNRRMHYVHRYSWQRSNGAIPDGMCVLHKCNNPSCVNIEHLSVGTQAENLAYMRAEGRQAIGALHGRAKLTEEEVRQIRDLRGYFTQRQIADMYGVLQTAVHNIQTRKTWQHI